nr:uncharacterized protein LOC113714062 [Coffea arabica]
MEERHSEENLGGRNVEEMEEPTHAEVTISKSPGKRKRSTQKGSTPQPNAEKNAEVQHTPKPSTKKSPRTRPEVQNTELSAKQTAKRKRSGKEPVTQPAKEPSPLPKFIDDEARDRFELETVAETRRKNIHETPVTPRTSRDQSMYVSPFTTHPRKSASKSFSSNSEVISLLEDLKQHVLLIEDGLMMTMSPAQQSIFIEKRNLLVPPIPEFNESAHQKEPRPQPTEHTPGTETTPEAHAFSSQPKDKGKVPVTMETTEDDDAETEDEDQVDPEQFRLTRRRPGSLKITI